MVCPICAKRKEEKMKEIYRSFEGKLDVGEDGYFVNELEDFYEIHTLSTRTGIPDELCRVRKSAMPDPDWADWYTIGKICVEVRNGVLDGQAFYDGKWYSTETIHKIQAKNKDYFWQRYV